MQLVSLISPSSQAIVGAKLKDGSITPFKCYFGRMLGEQISTDVRGQEWASSDVEFKSTPPL